MKTISLLLSITFFFCSGVFASENIMMPIPQNHIEYGCGCVYRLNRTAPFQIVFQSELNFEQPRAYIEGKLTSLESINVEALPKSPKVGDTFTQLYQHKNVTLKFSNTITFVCPLNNEGGCEVTEFKSRLEKKQNGQVTLVELFGDCGC